MRLVFMVEERSMKELLDRLLPRILPQHVSYLIIAHEGKTDLQKSIPIKLRAWNIPGDRFVIVQDQDSADCRELKGKLKRLCTEAGKPDVLIRIVCHELETWFLGDLLALEHAFHIKGLTSKQKSLKYRDPDALNNAAQELKKMVSEYQKINGARAVGAYIHIDQNCSRSFQAFISGLRQFIQEQS